MKRKTKALLAVIIIAAMLAGSFFVYVGSYYQAFDTAYESLVSSSDGEIKIQETNTYYFFDGASKDSALIFYPGAKVDTAAYAPLMRQIAEQGIADVYLVKMPFHLAIFGINRAQKIMNSADYEHWYIGGHSLGGAMAGSFAVRHQDELDGIIFLAAYPTSSLGNLKMLSIYGSEDGVLNRTHYEDDHRYWSSDAEEDVIQGGNHAQYADYGPQKGDGTALITADEQQKQTAELIGSWIKD